MKGSLGFGLAIISLIAFPWLAISVAYNLEVITIGGSSAVNSVCTSDCPTSQTILPGAGQSSGYGLYLYLAAIAVLFLGISYYAWRHDVSGRSDSLWSLPTTFVAAGLVYLLLVIFSSLKGFSLTGASAGSSVESSLAYVPLALVLVAAATAAVWALHRFRRTPPAPVAHEDGRRDAAGVLQGAIASLWSGTDPRSVIISCYRSLTEVLQKSGAVNSPTMTAREFELSSQQVLSVRHDTVHHLTALFEKARYSDGDVSRGEASEAEATLTELRLELEGKAGLK